jgi:hypothetical protein
MARSATLGSCNLALLNAEIGVLGNVIRFILKILVLLLGSALLVLGPAPFSRAAFLA